MEEAYETTIYGGIGSNVSLSVESKADTGRNMPEEVVPEKIIPDNIISEKETVSDLPVSNMEVSDEAWKADMEMNTVSAADRKEESGVPLYDYKPYSKMNEDEVKSEKTVGTKEWYESLTDKEKVEWLGISGCDLQTSIHIFLEKMAAIGYADKNSEEMLDEFMRLESELQAERQGKKAVPKFVR